MVEMGRSLLSEVDTDPLSTMCQLATELAFHLCLRVGEVSISNQVDEHTIHREDVVFQFYNSKMFFSRTLSLTRKLQASDLASWLSRIAMRSQLDPKLFSPKSLRIGGINTLVAGGASETDILGIAGHSNLAGSLAYRRSNLQSKGSLSIGHSLTNRDLSHMSPLKGDLSSSSV